MLTLRVTPNAKTNSIEAVEQRDDGTTMLRVRVNAVPDKGKANKAVIALLAKTLKLPKSVFTLVRGQTARIKQIEIFGDPDILIAKLTSILS